MKHGVDPDAYPMRAEFQESRKLQLMDKVALGRNRPLGFVCLAIGFTGQSLQILVSARARGYVSGRGYLLVLAETLAGVAVWAALGVWLGWSGILFAYGIPLVIANAVAMAYILTNHHLSPFTEVNDPLLNSLSVRVPRLVDFLHHRFGFHVEHHLFPSMSSVHGPAVRELIVKHWPERYQSMPLTQALWKLFRTPRVYSERTKLWDPVSDYECPTLLPRG
jgi:fatty acid desaturase